MRRAFFHRNFKKWLKENRNKFSYIPYLYEVKRKSFKVFFVGLKGYVYLQVTKNGEFSIWTKIRSSKIKYPWDCLADFDITEKKHGNLFSCGLCEVPRSSKVGLFKRDELHIEHSYLPLLQWCNQNLIYGNCLINFKVSNKESGGSMIINSLEYQSRENSGFFDGIEIINYFEFPKISKKLL